MRSTVWENKSNAAEEKETEACCNVKAFSPRVMTRWSPSASPRCQQPMRASKPTVWQHDDITAASQIEKADLFSGVWNPAFVALQPGMFKASGVRLTALCLLAAAAAICGCAWGLGSRNTENLDCVGLQLQGTGGPPEGGHTPATVRRVAVGHVTIASLRPGQTAWGAEVKLRATQRPTKTQKHKKYLQQNEVQLQLNTYSQHLTWTHLLLSHTKLTR